MNLLRSNVYAKGNREHLREPSEDSRAHEEALWEKLSYVEGSVKADVLDELSHIAYNRRNFIECLQLVDVSIEIFQSLGLERFAKDFIHVSLGKAYCLVHLERRSQAARVFEEIASLQKEGDDVAGYLTAIREAANNWFEAGEWQKSLDCYTAAKDAIDLDATPISMGIDLLNIGATYAKLNKHGAAIENFKSARALFKEAKNPVNVNWCDREISRSFCEIDNGFEAKFYAQRFFNYSKIIDDIEMEGDARYLLGKAHLLLEEFDDAEREIQRALEIFTRDDIKDWDSIIGANKVLIRVYSAIGRENEANERLKALKTIEEIFEAA